MEQTFRARSSLNCGLSERSGYEVPEPNKPSKREKQECHPNGSDLHYYLEF